MQRTSEHLSDLRVWILIKRDYGTAIVQAVYTDQALAEQSLRLARLADKRRRPRFFLLSKKISYTPYEVRSGND